MSERILKICRSVLNGHLRPILGCREISYSYISEELEDDEDAIALVGINSQTDHIYLGSEPVAQEYKEKCEAELTKFEPEIVERCSNIANRLERLRSESRESDSPDIKTRSTEDRER